MQVRSSYLEILPKGDSRSLIFSFARGGHQLVISELRA